VSFISDFSLPISLSGPLLDYVKEMASDPLALSFVKMQKDSATYKLKYGMAYLLRQRLIETLRRQKFSINLDECTANNNTKVLSILVSYFSEERKETVVDFYESVAVIKCTAVALLNIVLNLSIYVHLVCKSSSAMGERGSSSIQQMPSSKVGRSINVPFP
jgi:hypothetical protein